MDRISINGKDYPVAFNQMTQEIFFSKVDMEAVVNSSINATVYAVLRSGAYVNEKKLDLSFKEVVAWIDDTFENNDKSTIDEITEVCETWTECFWYKKILSKYQDQEDKKDKKKATKNTGTKSTK